MAHIGAVGGKFLHGKIVELKDVLDERGLLWGDDPLGAALFHQQPDLLLADLLVLRVGVHAAQPQHQVGGGGERPHDGGEEL